MNSKISARDTGDMLAEGAKRGTMPILTEWTAWADKVLAF